MSDAIGRKRSIMLAAIPSMIAWTMLGFADSFTFIIIAFLIMGLGLGLKEASSVTYTGEVTYVIDKCPKCRNFNVIFLGQISELTVKHQFVE